MLFLCRAGFQCLWGLSPWPLSRKTSGSRLDIAEQFSGCCEGENECSQHSVECGVITNDSSPRPERISMPSASPPGTHTLATLPLMVKGRSRLISNHVVIFWVLWWWQRHFTFFWYYSEIWLMPNLVKNRQYISSSVDLKVQLFPHVKCK